MFCRQCGKPVDEDDRFCRGCGADQEQSPRATPNLSQSPTTNPTSDSKTLVRNNFFYGTLFSCIGLMILSFTGWLKLDYYIANDTFSAFGTFKTMKNIFKATENADLFLFLALSFLFVAAFIISLVLLGLYCYRLFTDPEKSTWLSSGALNFAIGVYVSFIFVVFILCRGETLSQVLGFTPVPFISLAVAIVCKAYFLKNFEESLWYQLKQEKEPAKSVSVLCPSCSYRFDSSRGSCPQCGKRAE